MGALLAAAGGALAQCPPERVVSPTPWPASDFGYTVSLEGSVAVVGDPDDAGAVHVFRQRGSAWDREQTVFHSRIVDRDGFGAAVALDGRARFAASALRQDFGGERAGAVYIFEHDGATWHEVADILPIEPQWGNEFGRSLALRGDTLVVGAPRFQTASAAPGAAWVYRQIDGRWEFVQRLVPPDPRTGARFGNALAMDDQWLIVGARLDDEGGHHAGAVYIYQREAGGSYTFIRKLVAPGDPWNQIFGADVALDGTMMAVGAANGPAEGRGAVYTFELQDGEWRLTATLEHDDPVKDDALGASVALRGDTIVAGAPRQPLPGVSLGAAYVFHRRGDGSWRQAAKLLPEQQSYDFGRAVATDGASAIVGAPGETVFGLAGAGAAHIFDLACLLCRADLDGDGELTFFDFLAFQNLFAAGDPAADFDGDGALTFFDFLAFQNEFAAGCG